MNENTPGLDRLAVNLQALLAFSRVGRGYKAIKMIKTVSFAQEMYMIFADGSKNESKARANTRKM